MRDNSKETATKLKLAELQLKVREQDLDRARKDFLDVLAAKDKMNKEALTGVKDLAEAKSLIALLTAERDRYKEKLANTNTVLGDLRTDKDRLTQRVADLQTEAEQRFAGVPLTGESVIFLIDISGSMMMSDENTEDPEKWPFLCDTLMKLMQSIPTLQRFQVILFSDKVNYLFENRDFWLKYEGPKTAQATRDALKKVKVEGGTNMHDAFAEAFRYRKIKLDTVYLFSDGLPNIGPGVPASITKPTEAQRNHWLGQICPRQAQGRLEPLQRDPEERPHQRHRLLLRESRRRRLPLGDGPGASWQFCWFAVGVLVPEANQRPGRDIGLDSSLMLSLVPVPRPALCGTLPISLAVRSLPAGTHRSGHSGPPRRNRTWREAIRPDQVRQ